MQIVVRAEGPPSRKKRGKGGATPFWELTKGWASPHPILAENDLAFDLGGWALGLGPPFISSQTRLAGSQPFATSEGTRGS